MPTLARDFSAVAPDQRYRAVRQPEDGYDTGTQTGDMVALMEALGHRSFATVGVDTGLPIAGDPERAALLAGGPRACSGGRGCAPGRCCGGGRSSWPRRSARH
jgi:hypothetical protein